MSWGTNVLVGQSGGPTAVINSSLAGVYEAAKALGAAHVYGMEYGIQGLLQGKIVDLDDRLDDKMEIELLKRTPSSYLGSCRFKLPNPATDERPFVQLFELFAKYCIGAVFYIGGNDSMDTIAKLSAYGAAKGSEIRFIGVPKTIDNDLFGTDHCPGFGSVARYMAGTVRELGVDVRSLPIHVVVLEALGRNAGWTTAAAALAREFSVSRQIIVGDVALLRAGGLSIAATPRGYMLPEEHSGLVRTLACRHRADQMEDELNAIVDQGCTVIDVIVEHPIYGQLTGPLQLSSRYDVVQFVDRCRQSDALPLSNLTEGIHLHTISCPDETAFQRVQTALERLGVLLEA